MPKVSVTVNTIIGGTQQTAHVLAYAGFDPSGSLALDFTTAPAGSKGLIVDMGHYCFTVDGYSGQDGVVITRPKMIISLSR